MKQSYDIPPLPQQRVADPASFSGIVIQGVTKTFGEKTVLDEADLLVNKGETLVVIGRSGLYLPPLSSKA